MINLCIEINFVILFEETMESGRRTNQKMDDFMKGKGSPQKLSERSQKLTDAAGANPIPQVQYGTRGLPSNHNFR